VALDVDALRQKYALETGSGGCVVNGVEQYCRNRRLICWIRRRSVGAIRISCANPACPMRVGPSRDHRARGFGGLLTGARLRETGRAEPFGLIDKAADRRGTW